MTARGGVVSRYMKMYCGGFMELIRLALRKDNVP